MASFFENESDDDNSEVDEREYDNGEGSNDEDEDGSEDEEEVDFLEDPEDEAEEDEDESAAPSGEGNAQNSNRADFLSATEIRHLTAAFETCDQDDSGELSFDPFMKCLALMGKKVTAEEGKVFFDKMDEDKSGSIDINEWIGFYAGAMVMPLSPIAQHSFPGILYDQCHHHAGEKGVPRLIFSRFF